MANQEKVEKKKKTLDITVRLKPKTDDDLLYELYSSPDFPKEENPTEEELNRMFEYFLEEERLRSLIKEEEENIYWLPKNLIQ